ncbi:MAG: DNA repair protein RecN, partial [Anaerolineae bacterium]
MLVELTISNFAIIDTLRLTFTPGFNVLTGETGAGKSIIIDAVSLLLGARAATDVVRAGANTAVIEGLFRLTPALQAQIGPILEREGLEEDSADTLLLGREIRSAGRSFCRVNGRTVNLGLLAEIAAPLVDIHGQHQHLSLLQVKMHGAFLDRFGGLEPLRQKVAQQYKTLQTVRRELHTLQQNAQHIARRIDQLTFQVQEIQAANLRPTEEAELATERTRLANAERLNQLSSDAYTLLVEGSDGQSSAGDLLGQVARHLANLLRIDDSADDMVQLAEAITYQIEDLSGQLQAYAEAIEFSPRRLDEVEERLGLIYNLKRKYGDSIEEIIDFGKRAEAELKEINHAEDRIEELLAEQETLRRSLGKLAAQLSDERRKAGRRLGREVGPELKALGMGKTRFKAKLARIPHPDGVYVGDDTVACDETGIDRVEFLIAPNPGEPLKPMVKIASGGETSRLMLALKTVLALADQTPTLIFDEIDQGIGGRVGNVVGRKLWGLAHRANHQVLCITHLPQIATFGDTHFQVAKQIEGQRTTTGVGLLAGERRIEELAQMLGALSDTGRMSARELLE